MQFVTLFKQLSFNLFYVALNSSFQNSFSYHRIYSPTAPMVLTLLAITGSQTCFHKHIIQVNCLLYWFHPWLILCAIIRKLILNELIDILKWKTRLRRRLEGHHNKNHVWKRGLHGEIVRYTLNQVLENIRMNQYISNIVFVFISFVFLDKEI